VIVQREETLTGEAGATLSACGHYRHVLWRYWDRTLPALGWVMLNPSTADATVDDPTIRRCIRFAGDNGYGGIEVANLYQWRATDPAALYRLAPRDALGPDHLTALTAISGDGVPVVAAWGAIDRVHAHHARDVAAWLTHRGADLVCLGTTKAGWPRHPLYVRADQPLVPWEVPA
jgi:hypothetical protein